MDCHVGAIVIISLKDGIDMTNSANGSNFNQPIQLRNKALSMGELKEYLAPKDHTESMLQLLNILQQDEQKGEALAQNMQIHEQKQAFDR